MRFDDRPEPAKRLEEARIARGFDDAKKAATYFGWKYDTYAQHENGTRGIVRAADRYAKAFRVSQGWLLTGEGQGPGETVEVPATVTDVPRVSWVSAGQLVEQAQVTDLTDYPTEPAIDLPDGEWICLEVDGNSMNKISPPESLIFVNLKDKRLVTNGCYVVCDETGAATYKRYRPNEDPPFQPASYEDVPAPQFQGVVTVVGRVRRSIINM